MIDVWYVVWWNIDSDEMIDRLEPTKLILQWDDNGEMLDINSDDFENNLTL